MDNLRTFPADRLLIVEDKANWIKIKADHLSFIMLGIGSNGGALSHH
jgi:hypothetical protein